MNINILHKNMIVPILIMYLLLIFNEIHKTH